VRVSWRIWFVDSSGGRFDSAEHVARQSAYQRGEETIGQSMTAHCEHARSGAAPAESARWILGVQAVVAARA
jgi:hypothetical protein